MFTYTYIYDYVLLTTFFTTANHDRPLILLMTHVVLVSEPAECVAWHVASSNIHVLRVYMYVYLPTCTVYVYVYTYHRHARTYVDQIDRRRQDASSASIAGVNLRQSRPFAYIYVYIASAEARQAIIGRPLISFQ